VSGVTAQNLTLNLSQLESEGRFFRLESLDLESICHGSVEISETLVPLAQPECTGNIHKLEMQAGTGTDAGVP
jgi:hypothetical protein